ncbi:hypothetical protein BC827DRAFT_1266948 [Russula dissimulans]|nr:hypothetical protein BC827DRAFT_1266948 [Russula dissimulans]
MSAPANLNVGPSNSTPDPPNPPADPTATRQVNTTSRPGEIILTERFLSDPTWMATDLTLSLDKSNWVEWDGRLTPLTEEQGFNMWLNGQLKQPDVSTHPKAYWIWTNNNTSLRAFILKHIFPIEYEFLGPLARNGTSHAIYTKLKEWHKKLGLYSQVLLLKKGLESHFQQGLHLSGTISKIHRIHHQLTAMGPINSNNILAIFLLNALCKDFQDLQSTIQATSSDPIFSVNYRGPG